MKIIVTGSKGILGSSLVNHFDGKYDVKGYGKNTLDVRNRKIVLQTIKIENPNIIIHAAANTDAEYCEKNPQIAYAVNTIGTDNIVDGILENNNRTLLIYISSSGIYGDNKKCAYNEFDHPNPLTIHHKSKFFAEQSVSRLSKYLIIRTGWLFGGGLKKKKNFVYNRYLEARSNNSIYSDYQQKGNPTYVNDLCAQIELLIRGNHYGLFNCVGNGVASRYEYVKEIISYLGLSCDVKKSSHDKFQRVAPVSYNEVAINYKLKLLDIDIMRPWKEALYEYISKINFN